VQIPYDFTLLEKFVNESSSSSSEVEIDDLILVPNSATKCVICGDKIKARCTNVPYFARLELLLDYQLLILPDYHNCRICLHHLNPDQTTLKSDLEITRKYAEEPTVINQNQAGDLIKDLIDAVKVYRNASPF